MSGNDGQKTQLDHINAEVLAVFLYQIYRYAELSANITPLLLNKDSSKDTMEQMLLRRLIQQQKIMHDQFLSFLKKSLDDDKFKLINELLTYNVSNDNFTPEMAGKFVKSIEPVEFVSGLMTKLLQDEVFKNGFIGFTNSCNDIILLISKGYELSSELKAVPNITDKVATPLVLPLQFAGRLSLFCNEYDKLRNEESGAKLLNYQETQENVRLLAMQIVTRNDYADNFNFDLPTFLSLQAAHEKKPMLYNVALDICSRYCELSQTIDNLIMYNVWPSKDDEKEKLVQFILACENFSFPNNNLKTALEKNDLKQLKNLIENNDFNNLKTILLSMDSGVEKLKNKLEFNIHIDDRSDLQKKIYASIKEPMFKTNNIPSISDVQMEYNLNRYLYSFSPPKTPISYAQAKPLLDYINKHPKIILTQNSVVVLKNFTSSKKKFNNKTKQYRDVAEKLTAKCYDLSELVVDQKKKATAQWRSEQKGLEDVWRRQDPNNINIHVADKEWQLVADYIKDKNISKDTMLKITRKDLEKFAKEKKQPVNFIHHSFFIIPGKEGNFKIAALARSTKYINANGDEVLEGVSGYGAFGRLNPCIARSYDKDGNSLNNAEKLLAIKTVDNYTDSSDYNFTDIGPKNINEIEMSKNFYGGENVHAFARDRINDKDKIDRRWIGGNKMGSSKLYIVVPFFQGKTLRDYFIENPNAPEESLAIAKAIATAVEKFHNKNLIHCDIKPENIIIKSNDDGTYTANFVDLAFAHQLEKDKYTVEDDLHGTPDYMAPELDKSKHKGNQFTYSKASDMYALGVVFKELLGAEYVNTNTVFSKMTADKSIDRPEISIILEEVTKIAPLPAATASPEESAAAAPGPEQPKVRTKPVKPTPPSLSPAASLTSKRIGLTKLPEHTDYILNTIGDGNCGPRAAIQSLLLQGLLQDKKELVILVLSTIYLDDKDEFKGNLKEFTDGYAQITTIDDFLKFMQEYSPPADVTSDTRTPGEDFLTLLTNHLLVKMRDESVGEGIRGDGEGLDSDAQFESGKYVNMQYGIKYFAKLGINLHIEKMDKTSSQHFEGKDHEDMLGIYIIHSGEGFLAHYDALIKKDDVDALNNKVEFASIKLDNLLATGLDDYSSEASLTGSLGAGFYNNILDPAAYGYPDDDSLCDPTMRESRTLIQHVTPTKIFSRYSDLNEAQSRSVDASLKGDESSFVLNNVLGATPEIPLIDIVTICKLYEFKKSKDQTNKMEVYFKSNPNVAIAVVTGSASKDPQNKLCTITALATAENDTKNAMSVTLGIIDSMPDKNSIYPITVRNITTREQIVGFTAALFDYCLAEDGASYDYKKLKDIHINNTNSAEFKRALYEFCSDIADNLKNTEHGKFLENFIDKVPRHAPTNLPRAPAPHLPILHILHNYTQPKSLLQRAQETIFGPPTTKKPNC